MKVSTWVSASKTSRHVSSSSAIAQSSEPVHRHLQGRDDPSHEFFLSPVSGTVRFQIDTPELSRRDAGEPHSRLIPRLSGSRDHSSPDDQEYGAQRAHNPDALPRAEALSEHRARQHPPRCWLRPYAIDKAAAEALWRLSEKLTHVQFKL
jgi:hypothetical protein